MSANLIKIIKVDGIGNVYGFSRALVELHEPARIHVVHDQEMSEDLSELIDQIKLPRENRYVTGQKEFEDAFMPEILHRAWIDYLREHNRTPPDDWTVPNIDDLRNTCRADSTRKFSTELRCLSAGSGKKMTKPIFGSVLAQYVSDEDLPESLYLLLKKLENA